MPQRSPASSNQEDEDLDVVLVVLRVALHWKQNDLASASGIGNSSISDYERKKKSPGRKNLQKLLDAMRYRTGVVEFTRRFLHELRTAYRLAEGEVGVPLGEEAPATSGDSALRARVDQVSSEAGRAAENLVRLVLEMQLDREGKPEKG